jgi:hypothetical protein
MFSTTYKNMHIQSSFGSCPATHKDIYQKILAALSVQGVRLLSGEDDLLGESIMICIDWFNSVQATIGSVSFTETMMKTPCILITFVTSIEWIDNCHGISSRFTSTGIQVGLTDELEINMLELKIC